MHSMLFQIFFLWHCYRLKTLSASRESLKSESVHDKRLSVEFVLQKCNQTLSFSFTKSSKKLLATRYMWALTRTIMTFFFAVGIVRLLKEDAGTYIKTKQISHCDLCASHCLLNDISDFSKRSLSPYVSPRALCFWTLLTCAASLEEEPGRERKREPSLEEPEVEPGHCFWKLPHFWASLPKFLKLSLLLVPPPFRKSRQRPLSWVQVGIETRTRGWKDKWDRAVSQRTGKLPQIF